MIQVTFKNMKRSDFAMKSAIEKVTSLSEKFPSLRTGSVKITMEMKNSPLHAGPDLFTARLHVGDGRYRGVTISRSASNLYVALADLMDHVQETLKRRGDKARGKLRARIRLPLELRPVEV